MFGSRIAGKKLSTDGNLPSEYMNLGMAKLLKDSVGEKDFPTKF